MADDPRWELRWQRQAQRDLRALGRPEAERVRRAIETRLLPDPRRGEPLRGPGRPLWRFRVGDYRVLYVFNDEEVWVLVVRGTHHGNAYRGL
jgi:mRNA interferase RelE/StbE